LQKQEINMVNTIFNFYAYSNKLAAGGQPTEEQIIALKDDGFEAIVSIFSHQY
jgi:protein tyrosine phosphatase (PTP) superfamily phosphohydrolase (DUF442 family)